MRKIVVFNSVSLDGYFTDANGDMSWAHGGPNPEWDAFAAENASGDSELMFGRVTYDLMASSWPTAAGSQANPGVAEGINKASKLVFSTTLDQPTWENTKAVKGDVEAVATKMKESSGPTIVVMGSGTIVRQLADAKLVDEYQMVMVPVILGAGRTMFDGLRDRASLRLEKSRAFSNGNVVCWYSAPSA